MAVYVAEPPLENVGFNAKPQGRKDFALQLGVFAAWRFLLPRPSETRQQTAIVDAHRCSANAGYRIEGS